MRLLEELDERVGDDLADAADRGQVGVGFRFAIGRRARGDAKSVEGAEMARQEARIGLADMSDAERVDEARERDRAARVDRREEVLRARLAPALALF